MVINDQEYGLIIMPSQEKWDRMKNIFKKWSTLVAAEETELNHKELQSDRRFLVYCTQAYPGLTPYLKGVHLTLETCRRGRDDKAPGIGSAGQLASAENQMEEEIILEGRSKIPLPPGPSLGVTKVVPHLLSDLKALMKLALTRNRHSELYGTR